MKHEDKSPQNRAHFYLTERFQDSDDIVSDLGCLGTTSQIRRPHLFLSQIPFHGLVKESGRLGLFKVIQDHFGRQDRCNRVGQPLSNNVGG